MGYLVLVSCIWAFSFGLTKGVLAGLDSAFISTARLLLALLVFLPFLRLRGVSPGLALRLIGIGAVQYGLMYLCYNESFRHLAGHEVALFSLTTPLFVALLADVMEKQLRPRNLFAALLAIVAAGFVTLKSTSLGGTVRGIALMQVANLSFALGQIAYRRLRQSSAALRDHQLYALLFLGAVLLTAPVAFIRTGGDIPVLSEKQLLTLVYLGTIASGCCFFWWNVGATRVPAGVLAVFNNLKIPLAVACSLVVFGEKADLGRLAVSGSLLAMAFWLSTRPPATRPAA